MHNIFRHKSGLHDLAKLNRCSCVLMDIHFNIDNVWLTVYSLYWIPLSRGFGCWWRILRWLCTYWTSCCHGLFLVLGTQELFWQTDSESSIKITDPQILFRVQNVWYEMFLANPTYLLIFVLIEVCMSETAKERGTLIFIKQIRTHNLLVMNY
jgi:hypothetical protein